MKVFKNKYPVSLNVISSKGLRTEFTPRLSWLIGDHLSRASLYSLLTVSFMCYGKTSNIYYNFIFQDSLNITVTKLEILRKSKLKPKYVIRTSCSLSTDFRINRGGHWQTCNQSLGLHLKNALWDIWWVWG